MCPFLPVFIPIDIDVHSTDEELVLFLGRRIIGDPIPTNVITEVNPFSIDPRNSPENVWFLYDSHNEGSIIEARNGYWMSIDDLRILTNTPTVGRKAIREFYLGQAPAGDRTGWRMHEYHAEQMLAHGINKSRDNGRLCRFFLQNDELLNNEEQCDLVRPGDAGCENIVSVLPSLAEQGGKNPSLNDTANRCQVAGDNEQSQVESFAIPPQDVANENSIASMQAGYDFSKEDFLELKDLYDSESSSSSSDNSTVMSMSSDECFDAEALLSYIENESDSDASASASSRGSQRSASSSGSSPGSKSIRRMAKLRKKYCCFGSF